MHEQMLQKYDFTVINFKITKTIKTTSLIRDTLLYNNAVLILEHT